MTSPHEENNKTCQTFCYALVVIRVVTKEKEKEKIMHNNICFVIAMHWMMR